MPLLYIRAKQDTDKMAAVDALLVKHMVTEINKVCKCLKAGILGGHVKLLPPEEDPENKFNLDQVGFIWKTTKSHRCILAPPCRASPPGLPTI